MGSWNALLSSMSPRLHIWSQRCPKISIMECNIVRKMWNHKNRSIKVWMNRLSRDMEIEIRAPILGLLIFNTIIIHSKWMNLFSINPLSRVRIRHSLRKNIKIHIRWNNNKGLIQHERISSSKLRILIVRHPLWVGSNKPTRSKLRHRLANSSRLNNRVNKIHYNKRNVSRRSHHSSINLIDNNNVVPLGLQMF